MNISFQQIEMYYFGIRLVIHIVFPCIYVFQAAFLRPAGGWAPVPAAFPTVVRGEGKPAGPERQWAGWGGSQGGSAGENSLGERQESDHQRVRGGGGDRDRERDLWLIISFKCLHLFVFGLAVWNLEIQGVNKDSSCKNQMYFYEGTDSACLFIPAVRNKVELWSICSASSNTSS